MNTDTKIDFGLIKTRSREVATELDAAEKRSDRLQLGAALDPSKRAEADAAYAEVESLKRQEQSIRTAAKVALGQEEEAERQAAIDARKSAVEAARPLVSKWHEAARAFAEHLHAIGPKLDAMDEARSALLNAIPHGGGGLIKAKEWASIRDNASFSQRDKVGVAGVLYHSGLGEMGLLPGLDRFIVAQDINEMVARMHRWTETALNDIVEGD